MPGRRCPILVRPSRTFRCARLSRVCLEGAAVFKARDRRGHADDNQPRRAANDIAESGFGNARPSAPPVEAAARAPVATPPGRRWAVHDHVHHRALKLSALQSLDGGSGSLVLKFDKSKAPGAAPATMGDADGADLPVGRKDLLQITIGDLRGQVTHEQSGQSNALYLSGAAIIARARSTFGPLSRPSQRLGERQPSRLGLRYEVALPLRLAKYAIFLNGLSEPCQQALLRFAFPKLNKHKDILS